MSHVACVGDAEGVGDFDVVVVLEIPGIETEVEDGGETAGSEDGALADEFPADEMYAGEVAFPDVEDGEEADSDDDHGDEGGGLEVGATVRLEGEWEEEENEGKHEQDATDDCKREVVCQLNEQ